MKMIIIFGLTHLGVRAVFTFCFAHFEKDIRLVLGTFLFIFAFKVFLLAFCSTFSLLTRLLISTWAKDAASTETLTTEAGHAAEMITR